MSAAISTERILSVHHWNHTLFSFTTTRQSGFRFENGQFVTLGLEIEGKKVMRAYSIASPNYADYLEFLSIKVPEGRLTSYLQHIQVGDPILVSKKPTGTLLLHDLKPTGKHLYLLATGTGLAPFLSLIRDPEVYEQYEKVILFHGVRYESELAYRHYIEKELPQDEFLGQEVTNQLLYYPCVTQEKFYNQGRITDLILSNKLIEDLNERNKHLNLTPFDPTFDRVMLCGSAMMLKDTSAILRDRGFEVSRRIGQPADCVIEHAFVES
jgi:ferredoxin--NADP+ reductase